MITPVGTPENSPNKAPVVQANAPKKKDVGSAHGHLIGHAKRQLDFGSEPKRFKLLLEGDFDLRKL
jgi:hypothetical protein